MPPKKTHNKGGATTPDHTSEVPESFWDADPASLDSHEAAEQKKRFTEQISRLQQRQAELVEHTSKELEQLKRELENSDQVEESVRRAKEPLVQEVHKLKHVLSKAEEEKKQLAEELQKLHSNYQIHHSQMQGTLDSLKNIIRSQARNFDQQIRVFSLDANQSIESMLNSVETAQLPTFDETAFPKPAPVQFDPLPEPPVEHVETLVSAPIAQTVAFSLHETPAKREPKEKKARKPFSARRFAVRTVSLALIVTAGWWGMKYVNTQQQQSVASVLSGAKGQVAGASTDSQAAPTPDLYLESQVDLPFAATEWASIQDADYGVSFEYPKNTSNRVRTDTNLYVIRKDSYLLKATRYDSQKTLDQWWTENKGNVGQDYDGTKGIFKGLPAWIAKSSDPTDTNTVYVVKSKDQILQVLVAKPKDADDQRRVDHMIETFQFAK